MRDTIILQWLDRDTALVSVNDHWCSWSFMDYTMGSLPPHYPMPATLDVALTSLGRYDFGMLVKGWYHDKA